MKLVTNRILRRFGIRTVLIATAVAAGAGIALCSLIVPGSSSLLNGLILAFAGASRSLQLTAITMANFADITPTQRQPASVLASLTQQVGMGAGVAIGALLLTSSQIFRGTAVLDIGDFRVAFILAGALSTLAALSFMTLARDVGDEISGYRQGTTGMSGVFHASAFRRLGPLQPAHGLGTTAASINRTRSAKVPLTGAATP